MKPGQLTDVGISNIFKEKYGLEGFIVNPGPPHQPTVINQKPIVMSL